MRKKIMFVDERNVVNYVGGAEKIICDAASSFVHRGFDVSIVCMNLHMGMPFYPLDEKVAFVNLAYDYGKPFGGIVWLWKKLQKEILRGLGGRELIIGGKKYRNPRQDYFFGEFITRLSRCVAELKPDVIIAVSEDSAHIAQCAANVPVIAMCHCDPSLIMDKFTEEQKSAWQNARFIQVLQPHFAEEIKKFGYKNVVTIPNFVEQFDDGNTAGYDVCRKKILTAGRLEGIAKRQHLLLKAFFIAGEKFPDWTLDVYGAADNTGYKKKLEQMVKEADFAERVHFMGVTENFFAALSEADIFAFPSKNEGFGLAVAEAMSFGLPVVACRECYPNDDFIIDGQTGLLAGEGEESFAQKLMLLMENASLREKLGRAAHKAMKRYAAATVWDKWEELINNV